MNKHTQLTPAFIARELRRQDECAALRLRLSRLRAWVRKLQRDVEWVEGGSLMAFVTTAKMDLRAALAGKAPPRSGRRVKP